MNRKEQLQEQYEDALFALLMDDMMEEEGRQLLEENERLKQEPSAAVPEEVNARCIKTINRAFTRKRCRSVGRVTYKVFNKVAMAAVVCALLFVTACAVSPELRVNTLNFLIEVSDVATTLTLGGEADRQDTGSVTLTSGEEVLLLGYRIPEVPEGFFVDYEDATRSDAVIQYIRGDETIYFSVTQVNRGDQYMVDTEDAQVTNIQVGGYDGLFIEKIYQLDNGGTLDSAIAVWGDTEQSTFVYVEGSNVDHSLILELAKAVEFVGDAS